MREMVRVGSKTIATKGLRDVGRDGNDESTDRILKDGKGDIL